MRNTVQAWHGAGIPKNVHFEPMIPIDFKGNIKIKFDLIIQTS